MHDQDVFLCGIGVTCVTLVTLSLVTLSLKFGYSASVSGVVYGVTFRIGL